MLVVGAGGFAIQLSGVLDELGLLGNCVFFDDTQKQPRRFLDKFEIINSKEGAIEYLKQKGARFILGLGNPQLRREFYEFFTSFGATSLQILSKNATYGNYDLMIGEGTTVLAGCVIESTVRIGKGVLVNLNSVITHESTIANFCEIGPGVTICGKVEIGQETFLGAGAIVLPGVKIGKNVKIGAGVVVKKDVEDGQIVRN